MMNVILLLPLLLVCCTADVQFTFENKLPYTIWVGSQSSVDQNGQPLFPQIDGGGWEMAAHTTQEKSLPDSWSGRFWARTGCQFDGNGVSTQPCDTGDCGNKLKCDGAGGVTPVTLVEMTLKDKDGKDTYDISLVDGANVPASMTPTDQQGSGYSCTTASCPNDLNPECPSALQVERGGNIVACYSGCEKFQNDEYCCRGEYATADRCSANDYARYFKGKCPDAYSYAYDDNYSTFTCRDTRYTVTFGV